MRRGVEEMQNAECKTKSRWPIRTHAANPNGHIPGAIWIAPSALGVVWANDPGRRSALPWAGIKQAFGLHGSFWPSCQRSWCLPSCKPQASWRHWAGGAASLPISADRTGHGVKIRITFYQGVSPRTVTRFVSMYHAGVDPPPGLLTRLAQGLQETPAVLVVPENRLALISPRHRVIHRPRILNA
jgi:hypothetical protein